VRAAVCALARSARSQIELHPVSLDIDLSDRRPA
jgi:hypothetical protein